MIQSHSREWNHNIQEWDRFVSEGYGETYIFSMYKHGIKIIKHLKCDKLIILTPPKLSDSRRTTQKEMWKNRCQQYDEV